MLGIEADDLYGKPIAETAPEMGDLVDKARRRPRRGAMDQVAFTDSASRARTLLVRVTVEVEAGSVAGYVLTFDDITELLAAQRKAAWADVARRIAHEIKNPLTPIQLSAERLKRKYLRQIDSDAETFQVCTDTIVRHVGDIRRMVDEFSAFARLPDPVIEPTDLKDVVEEAVLLQATAAPDITFARDYPDIPATVQCDGRQIGRAVTNLISNAIDAIHGRAGDPASLPRGRIGVRIRPDHGVWTIELADNGRGLPQSEKERLTEPYVTTRDRGTGLGLAIVKKIMEEHGGDMELTDQPDGGACARLILAADDARGQGGDASADRETHPTTAIEAKAHGA
jgi:two-component system nitrogen regulation sensor histidine kinase NtrY